jgi:hypothetical protein
MFAGCSTVPPAAVKVVTVNHTAYIAVPSALLLPCPPGVASAIKTNNDLLLAFLADQAALATCNGQLQAIGKLTPPH